MSENKETMKNESLKMAIVLKEYLKKNNLSIRAFSKATSIPASTLFNYLIGGVMPRNSDHIKTLKDFLNISADELLFDEKPKNSKAIREGDVLEGKFKIIELKKVD